MSKSKQQLLDERYLRMARIWAENSYCERRQVGALIVLIIFAFCRCRQVFLCITNSC